MDGRGPGLCHEDWAGCAEFPGTQASRSGVYNTGDFNSNLTLSERRAQSFVSALRDDFDIANDCLAAIGAGELASVTDNESDYGKSLNIKVELFVINN